MILCLKDIAYYIFFYMIIYTYDRHDIFIIVDIKLKLIWTDKWMYKQSKYSTSNYFIVN